VIGFGGEGDSRHVTLGLGVTAGLADFRALWLLFSVGNELHVLETTILMTSCE